MSYLPPGTFTARALSFQHSFSKNGAPCISIEWGILSPPAYQNKTISSYHYFSTEKSSEISFRALEAAGWDGRDEMALDGVGTVEAELVVDEEEYQGKTRSKVQWVNKPGGGRASHAAPLEETEKSELRARLRAMRLATGGAPTAAVPVAQAGSDDDIPF